MPFTKLCVRSGTGYVRIPRDDLRLEGLLDEDGEVQERQEMHVQRAGEGTYIVRVVKDDGSLVPIEECEAVRRAAAEMALDRIEPTADSSDSLL